MSDSELSSPADVPADADIEQCLRRVVRDALKAENEITIKIARTQAEKELGLDAGWLKDSIEWKDKSKAIISAAVEEPESPQKSKKSAPKPKQKPATKAGTKRKSDEAQPRKKRQKKSVTSDEDEDDQEKSESEAPKSKAKKAKNGDTGRAVKDDEVPTGDDNNQGGTAVKSERDADEESALSEPPDDDEAEAPKTNGETVEADESDFSDVRDDPPARKKRQKKSSSPSRTTGKAKKPAKPPKPTKELSADEEEIKRLQGWLLKCGIRKIWAIELKKFDTDKAKIKHLKRMLEDVGMTGRYSVERARQIKEQRELAAELEATQEFAKKWGQKASDDEDSDDDDNDNEKEDKEDKPKEVATTRRKPRGFVDFGDSGDEGSD